MCLHQHCKCSVNRCSVLASALFSPALILSFKKLTRLTNRKKMETGTDQSPPLFIFLRPFCLMILISDLLKKLHYLSLPIIGSRALLMLWLIKKPTATKVWVFSAKSRFCSMVIFCSRPVRRRRFLEVKIVIVESMIYRRSWFTQAIMAV